MINSGTFLEWVRLDFKCKLKRERIGLFSHLQSVGVSAVYATI